MSNAIETLQTAMGKAMAVRPAVGGFPYLAEVLRQAGVRRNTWTLPACQSVYVMTDDVVVQQGALLVAGMATVPPFDEAALITAIRADQAGDSTFPEFLEATWRAGVTWYEADFEQRTVTYAGAKGETYVESYPSVSVA